MVTHHYPTVAVDHMIVTMTKEGLSRLKSQSLKVMIQIKRKEKNYIIQVKLFFQILGLIYCLFVNISLEKIWINY